MKIVRFTLVTVLLLTVAGAFAQGDPLDNLGREGTEWANFWWEQTGNKNLPRVLLIGDSVTNGYSASVRAALKGKALVDMVVTSASICDPSLLLEVQIATLGYKHSVIHFNNGLHGWHLTDAQYEAGLRRLVATLRRLAPDAKLIWGSSTPVVDMADPGSTLSKPNQRVIHLNELALKVMTELNIPVDDLYSAMAGHGEWRSDAYHYNQAGREAQGQIVSQALASLLGLPQ